jgi:hypothetical protein
VILTFPVGNDFQPKDSRYLSIYPSVCFPWSATEEADVVCIHSPLPASAINRNYISAYVHNLQNSVVSLQVITDLEASSHITSNI